MKQRALGVDIPIIPGIMPIASFFKLARFSDASGAELPRWMRRKFEGMGDDADSIRAFGLDVVTELCERLLGARPGPAFLFNEPVGPDARNLQATRLHIEEKAPAQAF